MEFTSPGCPNYDRYFGDRHPWIYFSVLLVLVGIPNRAAISTTCGITIMSLRKDHQNPHHPKTTFAGQLVCPHCQTAFPITWGRYWSAPWGNYRCPECKKISYAKGNSFWVYPSIIGAMLLGGMAAITLSVYFSNSFLIARLSFVAGVLFIGFPLDRWFDGHLRRLEPKRAK